HPAAVHLRRQPSEKNDPADGRRTLVTEATRRATFSDAAGGGDRFDVFLPRIGSQRRVGQPWQLPPISTLFEWGEAQDKARAVAVAVGRHEVAAVWREGD